MNIGILNATTSSGALKDSDILESRIIQAGHQVVRLFEPSLHFLHDGHRLSVLHKGVPLPQLDAIIARMNFVEDPSTHIQTLELLMQAGFRVINGRANYIAAKNKLVLQSLFEREGIPTPTWGIAGTRKGALHIIEQLGYPIIIKHPFGTWGKGVFYAENSETAVPIVDYLLVSSSHPILLQAFVGEQQDIRAFVVGKKVVGSMLRIAPQGDIRTTVSGNHTEVIELTKPEQRLAIQAAQALNLEYAGVDLIRTKNGTVVLEVNANPGLQRILHVVGTQIIDELLHCSSKTKRR